MRASLVHTNSLAKIVSFFVSDKYPKRKAFYLTQLHKRNIFLSVTFKESNNNAQNPDYQHQIKLRSTKNVLQKHQKRSLLLFSTAR